MPGSIFISHSADDREDVSALADVLIESFQGSLRAFNTSTGTAIQPGSAWRERIMEAIESAPLVLLWATPSALESPEVAFEIGAAFAYERDVLPCCIHIPPATLRWSLSERQALLMDKRDSWVHLAERVAQAVGYSAPIVQAPLTDLAQRFQAPSDALAMSALGYTLEFKNNSKSVVSNIKLEARPSGTASPDWLQGVSKVLNAGESVVVFRDQTSSESEVELSWTDITGARQRRVLSVPPTDKPAS